MALIRSRAPLRLGLAGGGTDVSPYCDLYGGYVLNVTIDRYAYAVIKTLDRPIVRFVATDCGVQQEDQLGAELRLEGELKLHKAVYSHMMLAYNGGLPLPLELNTFCDAPRGSGLGSSSTLVVTMVRAFVELLNLSLDDYSIAQLAYRLERVDCSLQGGRQDQYSATFGGFNFMEFYEGDRALINPLRIKEWVICELEGSLLLFYTGVSRESAKIIADQSANIESASEQSIQAMHGMKREALVAKEALLRGDFGSFVESMRRGWEHKKRTASAVSNRFVDEIYDAALGAGALAGRASGAGGGGYMLFFVPPERRIEVIRALDSFGGQVSNCHFTNNGVQAWRVP